MRAYKNKIRINLQRGTIDKQEQKFVKRYLCCFALNMQKIQRKHWQPQECSFVFYLHFKFNFLFFLHTSVKLLYFKGFDSIFMWKIMHTCTYKLVSCILLWYNILSWSQYRMCIHTSEAAVYVTLFIYGKHLVSWQWRPSTPSWFDTQLFFNITGACQERTSQNRFLMGTVSHTRESRQGLSIIHCESAKWFSFS